MVQCERIPFGANRQTDICGGLMLNLRYCVRCVAERCCSGKSTGCSKKRGAFKEQRQFVSKAEAKCPWNDNIWQMGKSSFPFTESPHKNEGCIRPSPVSLREKIVPGIRRGIAVKCRRIVS